MNILSKRLLLALGTGTSLVGIHLSLHSAPAPLHPATSASNYQKADAQARASMTTLSQDIKNAHVSEQGLARQVAADLQQVSGTEATLSQLQRVQTQVDSRLAAASVRATAPTVHASTGSSGGGGDDSGGDD